MLWYWNLQSFDIHYGKLFNNSAKLWKNFLLLAMKTNGEDRSNNLTLLLKHQASQNNARQNQFHSLSLLNMLEYDCLDIFEKLWCSSNNCGSKEIKEHILKYPKKTSKLAMQAAAQVSNVLMVVYLKKKFLSCFW